MSTRNRGKYRGKNGRYRLPGGVRLNCRARRLPGGPGRCVAGAGNQKLTESAEGNLLPLEQQPLKRLLPWLQVAGENGKLKHFD